MSPWFAEIRVGDACSIEGVDYRVAGIHACLAPDGDFWHEWLLVPADEKTRAALDAGHQRWIAQEADIGVTFWTPVDTPAGVTLANVDGLQKLEHRARVYRRMERGSYVVSRVQGTVGDRRSGERVEYVELLAGSDRLDLEWTAHGIAACEGRRIKSTAVRDWFALRGVSLEGRTLERSAQRFRKQELPPPTVHSDPSAEAWGWVIGLLIAVPFILLESCSSHCQERYNAQTQKTEYVCSDGSVRNSRPWFGK